MKARKLIAPTKIICGIFSSAQMDERLRLRPKRLLFYKHFPRRTFFRLRKSGRFEHAKADLENSGIDFYNTNRTYTRGL